MQFPIIPLDGSNAPLNWFAIKSQKAKRKKKHEEEVSFVVVLLFVSC